MLHPESSPESAGYFWNRFEIPTKNDSLSSGFPFHPRLYDLKVTHDQWSLFSSDLVNAAKLTLSEDFLSWASGITAGTITSPFLFVLGPVAGYYTGRLVHRKTVVKTVKERLGQEGDIRSVLRRWNKDTFEEKGFQAWLELPLDPKQLNKDEVMVDAPGDAKAKKKAAKKAARRFRIIIVPSGDQVTTEAESSSGITPPNSIPLVEAPTDPRPAQELQDLSSEPPAYSPSSPWGSTDMQPDDIPRSEHELNIPQKLGM